MTDTIPAARPYGTWPSPISAADVARQHRLISFPMAAGGDVWWQERLPGEGARTTVVRLSGDGRREQVLPGPWDARTRVHEYGGRSYQPVPAGPGGGAPRLLFANLQDQRLYIVGMPGNGKAAPVPRPITPPAADSPENPDLRYADFVLSHDETEVWCVRERHEDGKVARAIVAVPLDGSAAEDGAAVRELVTGADFYAFPTPSPDGSRVAWICWNHPRMPWDGTELRVARITDGVVGKGGLIKGGIRESVMAPLWRDETSLYVASDWPGWWNLYQLGLTGEPAQALCPAEEEFAEPLWQLGHRPYAILPDGRLAVLHGRGGMHLGVLDPDTGELADLDIPLPVFASGLSADGSSVIGMAGSPSAPLAVIRVDMVTGQAETLASEAGEVPAAGYLPQPRQMRLEGRFGQTVHALVYPPANQDVTAPEGELPPYVVWVHGGPTSHVTATFDLEKAYFTSRGIGVVAVNYGGSTGYGRSYRERLRMQWGVVDVEDAVAAAEALAGSGEADGARLAIRGGSAGGWTALAAITVHAATRRVFSAATSYFGVADLRTFAATTHDFESHYLDGLVGPLPGFDAVYAERSPIGHVSGHTCPVLLLQGLSDPVVPPAQAQAIAAELTEHGIRHALIEFEGESHGFRGLETIVTALEAELAFYGQILGFRPPGVQPVDLSAPSAGELDRS